MHRGTKGYKYLHGVHPGLKEEAELAAEADRSEISVFLDGSGYEGHISVAAVLYRGGEEKCSIRKFMGSEERHMVFKAELLGLSLAVEMVKGERQVWSLTIRVDSQAAMHAIGHRRAIPGQHLVEAFHEQVAAVWNKHPSIEIRVRWTPGHEGIQGNERVDREANRRPRASRANDAGYQWCAEVICRSAGRQLASATRNG